MRDCPRRRQGQSSGGGRRERLLGPAGRVTLARVTVSSGRGAVPKADVNGIQLYYETHGSGDAMLFVSGTGVTRHTWLPFQVPFFSKHYTCIVYDHRGLGDSEKPAGPSSTRLFASDAAGLLDALGFERAIIMGHSMGGRVCQWIALDYPQKVRAM